MSDDTSDSVNSFPISARNRVRREHERGSYDKEAVFAILDAGILCHVAYVIDGQPYCTPTMHWREGETLYWHGSSASRMLRQLKGGTPVCLTVSHLDGLVLARSGFNHSMNYRSVMCFGTAHIIDDEEEKNIALKAVVDRLYPNRTQELRTMTVQEAKATTVIGMVIEEASAKARAKGVNDDEKDFEHPAWAGIIPVQTVLGEDQLCPHLLPDVPRPESLALYRAGRRLDDVLVETQRLYEAQIASGAKKKR